MKKSCLDCKALNSLGKGNMSCAFRKSVEISYNDHLGLWSVKPKEECPKPKTNKELVKLMMSKTK